MKITDYCIIFGITALCFITVISEKGRLTYNKMYINNRYNVIMDNGVENALRASYESVDNSGNPVVNLDTASDYLLDEVSVMFDGNKILEDYYYDRIALIIYTDDRGYYQYDKVRGWSGVKLYSDGSDTSHQDKISELLTFVEKEYNIILSVPYNDGENYENSIDDYSLIAIYEGYDGIYCFSAAKISEVK